MNAKRLDTISNYTENPLGNLQRAEYRKALKNAIKNLPPKLRQAIELVHRHKGNFSKASVEANCSAEILRKRHEYVVHLLKKEFEKDKDEF